MANRDEQGRFLPGHKVQDEVRQKDMRRLQARWNAILNSPLGPKVFSPAANQAAAQWLQSNWEALNDIVEFRERYAGWTPQHWEYVTQQGLLGAYLSEFVHDVYTNPGRYDFATGEEAVAALARAAPFNNRTGVSDEDFAVNLAREIDGAVNIAREAVAAADSAIVAEPESTRATLERAYAAVAAGTTLGERVAAPRQKQAKEAPPPLMSEEHRAEYRAKSRDAASRRGDLDTAWDTVAERDPVRREANLDRATVEAEYRAGRVGYDEAADLLRFLDYEAGMRGELQDLGPESKRRLDIRTAYEAVAARDRRAMGVLPEAQDAWFSPDSLTRIRARTVRDFQRGKSDRLPVARVKVGPDPSSPPRTMDEVRDLSANMRDAEREARYRDVDSYRQTTADRAASTYDSGPTLSRRELLDRVADAYSPQSEDSNGNE